MVQYETTCLRDGWRMGHYKEERLRKSWNRGFAPPDQLGDGITKGCLRLYGTAVNIKRFDCLQSGRAMRSGMLSSQIIYVH